MSTLPPVNASYRYPFYLFTSGSADTFSFSCKFPIVVKD